VIALVALTLLAGGRPWAIDADGGVVRIAAAGDISDAKLSGQAQTAALLADGGYEAILLLGDDQYPGGALEDYQKYFAPTWGQFLDRLRPVPGNHEYYASKDAAGYFSYFGERAGAKGKGWYSYDLGAWHFIALNTNTACKTVACDAKSEQVRWLRDDLAAHPNRCTLAYFHHPRFSSGAVHGDFVGAEALWQTLQTFGVDVVLNGHEHIYERFEPMGSVREFVVGTGGMSHYEVKPVAHQGSAIRNTDAFGVLEMTLRPGEYDWRFLPVPPATFSDSGSATCR
jgi:hypothetical protein